MGVYLYSLRAENVKAELNGSPVQVHACKYLLKLSWSREPRLHKMLIGRAGNYWEGRELPKYVAFAEDSSKPFVGGEDVFLWRGQCLWYDTDEVPGIRVGTLKIEHDENKRRGLKWS